MTDVNGKTAIVTGASRGIGKVIAEQLASSGIKVAVNYANHSEQAEAVVKGIRAKGGEAKAIKADISKLPEIERLFTETISTFGKVDILVNNAGMMKTTMLKDVTEEEFDRHFSINAKGTFFACQQAMKYMEDGGRIINISTSVLGQMFPGYSVYAGTKGAAEQFTRQLAKEFGAKNITINAVAPGPINTELFIADKTEEQISALTKSNAFHRLGEAEDIAGVIGFLVSEQSEWVTGQTIRVNGGFI
ncbi:SDR family oxidoreductase [Bacillus sp. ISL-51]|uniref:SDR family oxidoreductase n=1 Tax=unclassified Bacillus (in: firmicutes) TaxID=185979 RepID=UPI001BE8FD6F|nr:MULTISPECIES: SDR family oxidoreductase [unclassified Bacillus (in: firmicutes)]MBT2574279.1 SDR family oxidoreductase [Bacillus sp. ISL-51]MBT2633096.1 SDR family oxidoreductase [Bacillus sp. ISL-26]